MRLHSPLKFVINSQNDHGVTLKGERGELLSVSVLEQDIVRVSHHPEGRARMPLTWMIADANGKVPGKGRQRDDLSQFSRPPVSILGATNAVTVSTASLTINVCLNPVSLRWTTSNGGVVCEDLPERAYAYDLADKHIYHYLKRSPEMLFYGFGEKSGRLNKHGRRMRMFNLDALGYDAERSDPLYKNWPFYITFIPETQVAYGLLYDNLTTSVFDMGSEHHNFFAPYRYYSAEDGDLDYYLILGPSLREVIEKLGRLIGHMALPPRWTLGYLGSTMSYTDSPNAQERLKEFARLCEMHDIPCDLFHLSSGYTAGDDGKRYVFNWNRKRIPEPQKMVDDFHSHGIRLSANVKPCLLTTHPRFSEVEAFGGFIKAAGQNEPQLDAFWGGLGAHLDFTNEETFRWWKQNLKAQLLDFGIDSIWNDNNEFTVWDDAARCHGFGEERTVSLSGRALQTLLMAQASFEALSERDSNERPYLITRSGCPGVQRYAQTWTGDNRCDWHTLRYNIPMGLGLSLSGMANFGHDVGGFAGKKPEPELFVRWVQNGIFMPRFTIHSWHDDGSINEPWMYPEVLPIIRNAIKFRYQIIPYLYSLLVESSKTGHPIIRPLVYEFAQDEAVYDESFDFLLGSHWLIASVWEPGIRTRKVYLPRGTSWCDFQAGTWWDGGQSVELAAPLEYIPSLVRDGGLIPVAPPMPVRRHTTPASDSLQVLAFPAPQGGAASFIVTEDDGLSRDYLKNAFSELSLQMTYDANYIDLNAKLRIAGFALPYRFVEWIFPSGESREIHGVERADIGEDGRLRAITPISR